MRSCETVRCGTQVLSAVWYDIVGRAVYEAQHDGMWMHSYCFVSIAWILVDGGPDHGMVRAESLKQKKVQANHVRCTCGLMGQARKAYEALNAVGQCN